MASALRVKRRDLRRLWKSAAVLLAGGTSPMWLFSGLIAYGVFGFSAAAAFLIGAIITPTDPVIAGSWSPESSLRHISRSASDT